MARYFRNARFAILFLILLMIGRFILGARGVPFEKGTGVFSMVSFSYFASLLYGAFSRRGWAFNWKQAMLQGGSIALSAQVLIFLATLSSYLAGTETYFNNPIALNQTAAVPLVQAMVIRLVGMVVNTIITSIAGLIGWSLGKLLPEKG